MTAVAERRNPAAFENAILVFPGREDPVDVPTRRDVRSLDADDVLPTNLGSVLREGAGLLVLDALAFPFEAMGEVERHVPLAVRMPDRLAPSELFSLFEDDLFFHLTTLDSVIVDVERWPAMSARYLLPDDRRLEPDSGETVLRAAVRRFNQDREAQDLERPDAVPLAGGAPATALFGRHPRLRAAKTRLWTDTRELRRALQDLEERQPEIRPLHVVEISTVTARLLPALPRTTSSYRGFDVWGQEARQVTCGDRTFQVEPLDDHLRLPVEPQSADVVLVTADIATNPHHLIRRLSQEAVRAIRPGGFVVFLLDLVPRSEAEKNAMLGATAFVNLVSGAAGQRLMLDGIRSIRHPGEDLHRAGILVFHRTGVPTRW